MKLLANCPAPGQRIPTLRPPEALLFTHSAAVCVQPEKAFCRCLFALSAAAMCLHKNPKQKLTSLPDYIDSSTVKPPGIRGRTGDVFLLSRCVRFHLEESKSQSGITFLTIIYKLCTACV